VTITEFKLLGIGCHGERVITLPLSDYQLFNEKEMTKGKAEGRP
jgi:hypothetical protein